MTPPELLPPFTFHPILKTAIWGGSFIKYFKRLTDCSLSSVGESWEVSGLEGNESVVAEGPDAGLKISELIAKYGERLLGADSVKRFGMRFPLLVKYIDAARDLSVQVHPDRDMARQIGLDSGKSEMWHVVRSGGGAKIYAGFKLPLTVEEYEASVKDHSITDKINAYRTRPDETYILPAGTIHAIGAGNFLLEVQESSDVTYRVYDYGRIDTDGKPRELHSRQARQALSLDAFYAKLPEVNQKNQQETLLIDTDWTHIRRHNVKGELTVEFPRDSFTIITCIDGEMTLSYPGSDLHIQSGTTCLLESGVVGVRLKGKGSIVSATV